MNLHLAFIAFAVIATVATASENLRKSAKTDAFFNKVSAAPKAKRTQKSLDSLAKFKRNMQKAAANARKSGAANFAGKALTETYADFYVSVLDYSNDVCADTPTYTMIEATWCEVYDDIVGGVTYASTKYQSNSGCTSIQEQKFIANDCTGIPVTTNFASTFDSECDGEGLVITDFHDDDMYADHDDHDDHHHHDHDDDHHHHDDDHHHVVVHHDHDDHHHHDNGPDDSFSCKKAYCGWTNPGSTVESPQMTTKFYPNSLTCAGNPAVWVFVSATCMNDSGGTSYSTSSTGIITSYSELNCAGTATVDIVSITTGCVAGSGADSGSARNKYIAAGETADDDVSDLGSSSPAAHWTVNAGLAALLAAVACMAI